MIGDRAALPVVERLAGDTADDEIQAGAIFAYVEVLGHDGKDGLRKISPNALTERRLKVLSIMIRAARNP